MLALEPANRIINDLLHEKFTKSVAQTVSQRSLADPAVHSLAPTTDLPRWIKRS